MDREEINQGMPSTREFMLSHAIMHNYEYTMEISGQIGLDSRTGKLASGIEAETRQALSNIEEILTKVGWRFGDIVKVRIFVTSMRNYQKVNEVCTRKFIRELPAVTVVGVNELPMGASVEIECTAAGNYKK